MKKSFVVISSLSLAALSMTASPARAGEFWANRELGVDLITIDNATTAPDVDTSGDFSVSKYFANADIKDAKDHLNNVQKKVQKAEDVLLAINKWANNSESVTLPKFTLDDKAVFDQFCNSPFDSLDGLDGDQKAISAVFDETITSLQKLAKDENDAASKMWNNWQKEHYVTPDGLTANSPLDNRSRADFEAAKAKHKKIQEGVYAAGQAALDAVKRLQEIKGDRLQAYSEAQTEIAKKAGKINDKGATLKSRCSIAQPAIDGIFANLDKVKSAVYSQATDKVRAADGLPPLASSSEVKDQE